ncbi:MAG: UTP--glucose-1-phosphate uridylyltransferase [Candidatus Omnitrophica bacterium]|nr:UTP--glucose-1-phosphate uridylyltransferase [Candidatus Omnitrophota bacterium]
MTIKKNHSKYTIGNKIIVILLIQTFVLSNAPWSYAGNLNEQKCETDMPTLSPHLNISNLKEIFILRTEELTSGNIPVEVFRESSVASSHTIELKYTFTYIDAFASRVYLIGEFNDWKKDDPEFEFRKVSGDEWELTVPSFAVGTQYKIIVDGVWHTDYNNPVQREVEFKIEGKEYKAFNSIFIAEQRYAVVEHLLREIGQEHLFQEWSKRGENQQEKTEFFEQILEGDRNSPYGLRRYWGDGKSELEKAIRGVNPFAGYNPEVPDGIQVAGIGDEFRRLQNEGSKYANKLVVTMVAGGVGDRLGAKQPKALIPVSLVDEQKYILLYIDTILALQERSNRLNGTKDRIPFIIMTSVDTHNETIKFLHEEGYSYREVKDKRYGSYRYMDSYIEMEKGESLIQIIKQGTVPALVDKDARFARGEDPYKILKKPHGHGDIHMLLEDSGLAKRWENEGKTHMIFIQDTNSQVVNAILPGLTVSMEQGFNMNFLTVPREAGEAAGGIVKLVDRQGDGSYLVGNVEYNQLDPLLKAVFKQEVAETLLDRLNISDKVKSQAQEVITGSFTQITKIFENLKAMARLTMNEKQFIEIMAEAALEVGQKKNLQQDKIVRTVADELLKYAISRKHAFETARQLKISNGKMEKAIEIIENNSSLFLMRNQLRMLEPGKDIRRKDLIHNMRIAMSKVNEVSEIMLDISIDEEESMVKRGFAIPQKKLEAAEVVILHNLNNTDSIAKELSQLLGERVGKRIVETEIVRANLKNSGDIPDPKTGKSPFPGNLNVFILALKPYVQVLDKTKGIMPEFINPKFYDKEKTKFKPTRLETMMQDLAFKMTKVGFTNFQDKRLVFSPVKNNTKDAVEKQKSGNYPDHMATGESDYLKIYRAFLATIGVNIDVEGDEVSTADGILIRSGAQVVWTPRSSQTIDELRTKFKGGIIEKKSTLFWDGENVVFDQPHINGALMVNVAQQSVVTLRNISVQNKGWHRIELEEGDAAYMMMRGYKLGREEKTDIIIEGKGPIVLEGVEMVGNVKIESKYNGTNPVGLKNIRLENKLVTINKQGDITIAPISEDIAPDILTGFNPGESMMKEKIGVSMLSIAI